MSGRAKSNAKKSKSTVAKPTASRKSNVAKVGASSKSNASDATTAVVDDGDDDFLDGEGGDIPTGDEIGTVEVTNSSEIKLYASAREMQKKKLESIRHKKAIQGEQTTEARLKYLMQQSEVFAHFLGNGMADEMKSLSTNSLTGLASSSSSTKLNEKAAAGKDGKDGKPPSRRGRMKEADEDRRMMQMAENSSNVVRLTKQPPNISGEMRAYQIEGLNWMIRLHDNNINGILADEMGLGKTLQCISLLAYLRNSRKINGPHIIIVPKSVVSNWLREFTKWCPEIKTLRLLGDKVERHRVVTEDMIVGKFDVLVCSYESLLRESFRIMKIKWKYLIIDEAHRIKNEQSNLSKVVRNIKTDFRLLITGTPLQNNLHELWALLNFLLPDVFHDSDTFDNWFNTEDKEGQENVVKRLHTVLNPFLLRRVKADVDSTIPPKTETKLFIGMSDLQREWYTKVISKDVQSLNMMASSSSDRNRLLNMLVQLRKVCNHPYLFDGAEPGPPYFDGPHLWQTAGKMTLLDKLLPKLKSQGSRVLIFSQMTRMLDILEDYFTIRNRSGANYKYCRIDGSTPGDARDSMMDEFNKDGSDKFCFLLSTRAGGLGINLQTADTVILYDSDWNPQVDLQAMDRAHRIGQKKPVRVFRFVTEGSVEEKVIERADRKLFLDAAVIQQGRLADKHTQLSNVELMTMVRFGADEIINSKGGSLTDEDIDVLLAKGESRSEESKKLIQNQMQHSLANFSSHMDSDEYNLFTFEGQDYSTSQKSRRVMQPLDGMKLVNLPQRDRKRNYDVDEYFREALTQLGPTSQEKRELHRELGGFQRAARKFVREKVTDFHFFPKRFHEIQNIEEALFQKRDGQKALIKQLQQFKPRKCSADEEQRTPAEAAAAGETLINGLTWRDIPRLVAEVKNDTDGPFVVPDAILNEKTKLRQQAFTDWDKGQFRIFLDVLEQNGNSETRVDTWNDSIDKIAHGTKKPKEDVITYFKVFNARMRELEQYEKIYDRVLKGTKRVERTEVAQKIIREKIEEIGGKVIYLQGVKGKYYTEENDNAILWFMYKYGYGNSQEIMNAIRRCRLFQFDYFIRSRKIDEIGRRCEVVVRFVEKEVFRHRQERLQQKSMFYGSQRIVNPHLSADVREQFAKQYAENEPADTTKRAVVAVETPEIIIRTNKGKRNKMLSSEFDLFSETAGRRDKKEADLEALLAREDKYTIENIAKYLKGRKPADSATAKAAASLPGREKKRGRRSKKEIAEELAQINKAKAKTELENGLEITTKLEIEIGTRSLGTPLVIGGGRGYSCPRRAPIKVEPVVGPKKRGRKKKEATVTADGLPIIGLPGTNPLIVDVLGNPIEGQLHHVPSARGAVPLEMSALPVTKKMKTELETVDGEIAVLAAEEDGMAVVEATESQEAAESAVPPPAV